MIRMGQTLHYAYEPIPESEQHKYTVAKWGPPIRRMDDEWIEIDFDGPPPEEQLIRCRHAIVTTLIEPISEIAPPMKFTTVVCKQKVWQENTTYLVDRWSEYTGTCLDCGKEWKFRTPKRLIRTGV